MIAEDQPHWRLRPGLIDFIQWLQERGHHLAIWTAAGESWATMNANRICQRVHGNHECTMPKCKKTFSFVWDSTKQTAMRKIPFTRDDGDGCLWCGPYSRVCDRCTCHIYNWWCPCRCVKELRKVWKDPSIEGFSEERTLIIENTPQQCILNYGNAIYVPTFKGNFLREKDMMIWGRLKAYILQLEKVENVREVKKCVHARRPHACYYQYWREMDPFVRPQTKANNNDRIIIDNNKVEDRNNTKQEKTATINRYENTKQKKKIIKL